jgi:PPOX class probable F420-dependent enzyme
LTALSLDEHAFLNSAQVGHLGTASRGAKPHVVPVCYAVIDETIYIVMDRKPKKSEETGKLRRVANILENSQVCLTVDRYDEDWSRLAFVMIHGKAELIGGGARHKVTLEALRTRYLPYRQQELEQRPIIAIQIERVSSWGQLRQI